MFIKRKNIYMSLLSTIISTVIYFILVLFMSEKSLSYVELVTFFLIYLVVFYMIINPLSNWLSTR